MCKLQFIKTFKIFLSFIVGLIIFSCQNTIPNKEYFDDMQKYLNKVHNIKNGDSEKPYLLINLNCLDCLGRNVKKLETLTEKDSNFIFIGKTVEPEILSVIRNIKGKNTVFIDVENKASLYELNFLKAILLKIKNSEIREYIVYHGLNTQKIEKDILRKN